jgi:uncharacterized membrane protein
MIRYALLWLGAFVFTSAIDAFWHLVLFGRAYKEGLRPLARMADGKFAFKGAAALLSQALVVTALLLLVLIKSEGATWAAAALIGALAGILAISVYGVTNYALLKDWGLAITLLEIAWGPIIGGCSGAFAFWLKSLFIR